MDKSILREKYLKIRKNIDKENRLKYDNEIFSQVIKMNEYKENNLVLTYVSLSDEVDTIKIIEYSLKIGKKVAVPKCEGSIIKFYYIKSINELKEGCFGILEPENKYIVTNFESSICLVPGITFDRDNNRVGYGKGYYDKFLKNYQGVKLGLTYKECICDKINVEKYDVKVDKVITNS